MATPGTIPSVASFGLSFGLLITIVTFVVVVVSTIPRRRFLGVETTRQRTSSGIWIKTTIQRLRPVQTLIQDATDSSATTDESWRIAAEQAASIVSRSLCCNRFQEEYSIRLMVLSSKDYADVNARVHKNTMQPQLPIESGSASFSPRIFDCRIVDSGVTCAMTQMHFKHLIRYRPPNNDNATCIDVNRPPAIVAGQNGSGGASHIDQNGNRATPSNRDFLCACGVDDLDRLFSPYDGVIYVDESRVLPHDQGPKSDSGYADATTVITHHMLHLLGIQSTVFCDDACGTRSQDVYISSDLLESNLGRSDVNVETARSHALKRTAAPLVRFAFHGAPSALDHCIMSNTHSMDKASNSSTIGHILTRGNQPNPTISFPTVRYDPTRMRMLTGDAPTVHIMNVTKADIEDIEPKDVVDWFQGTSHPSAVLQRHVLCVWAQAPIDNTQHMGKDVRCTATSSVWGFERTVRDVQHVMISEFADTWTAFPAVFAPKRWTYQARAHLPVFPYSNGCNNVLTNQYVRPIRGWLGDADHVLLSAMGYDTLMTRLI